MSYSFGYGAPGPTLTPTNLGYLYNTDQTVSPLPTITYTNRTTTEIINFGTVPAGVYLFTSTGYVTGSTEVLGTTDIYYNWTFGLSPTTDPLGTSSFCRTTVFGAPAHVVDGADIDTLGAGFSLCNTFQIKTSQDLSFYIYPDMISSDLSLTAVLFSYTVNLCRIA